MSGNGKSIRDALAGKELIGFARSSEHGKGTLQRASTTKIDIVKAPEPPVSGTKQSAGGGRA
jgi:hypothetical protein